MITYTLKVVDIRRETKDTITLCFKQPALRKIKYAAGQYLTLIFRINGRRYLRPYSFSSAPIVDPSLDVTVKRVPNGIISNHIHDQIRIGDVIEVLEPMGDFIIQADEDIDKIYFWGVGSGITPLISLIKSILFDKRKIKAMLIYGNRNLESTIFSDAIERLMGDYPTTFEVLHFHTELEIRKESPYVTEGRINKKDILRIVNMEKSKNTRHFICGPIGLKESVKEVLGALKIPKEYIFTEDFELIKNPEDFKDIKTRNITLRFQNIIHNLEVIKGKSILESALDGGIELPYSCQTGSCSTCKANKLKGELKMIGLTKERNDLILDEYLLCCSYPLTDNVYIEI
jgi:ring-1,2-phenylacetyl-CoA epoxidase subunit PaaE